MRVAGPPNTPPCLVIDEHGHARGSAQGHLHGGERTGGARRWLLNVGVGDATADQALPCAASWCHVLRRAVQHARTLQSKQGMPEPCRRALSIINQLCFICLGAACFSATTLVQPAGALQCCTHVPCRTRGHTPATLWGRTTPHLHFDGERVFVGAGGCRCLLVGGQYGAGLDARAAGGHPHSLRRRADDAWRQGQGGGHQARA